MGQYRACIPLYIEKVDFWSGVGDACTNWILLCSWIWVSANTFTRWYSKIWTVKRQWQNSLWKFNWLVFICTLWKKVALVSFLTGFCTKLNTYNPWDSFSDKLGKVLRNLNRGSRMEEVQLNVLPCCVPGSLLLNGQRFRVASMVLCFHRCRVA